MSRPNAALPNGHRAVGERGEYNMPNILCRFVISISLLIGSYCLSSEDPGMHSSASPLARHL